MKYRYFRGVCPSPGNSCMKPCELCCFGLGLSVPLERWPMPLSGQLQRADVTAGTQHVFHRQTEFLQQGTRSNQKLCLDEGLCQPPLRFAPQKCMPSWPATLGWRQACLTEVACQTRKKSVSSRWVYFQETY